MIPGYLNGIFLKVVLEENITIYGQQKLTRNIPKSKREALKVKWEVLKSKKEVPKVILRVKLPRPIFYSNTTVIKPKGVLFYIFKGYLPTIIFRSYLPNYLRAPYLVT